MPSLQEFKNICRSNYKRPDSSIEQRWRDRILGENMSGRAGGLLYISKYLKNAKVDKVQAMARRAEQAGDLAMSETFWVEAYRLQYGTENAQPATTRAASEDWNRENPKPKKTSTESTAIDGDRDI